MFNLNLRALCLLLGTLLPVASHATLVTQGPASGFAQIDFSGHPTQEITLGPVGFTATNGTQVEFTASNTFGSAGFSGFMYGLGSNGTWDAASHSFAWVNGGDQGGIGSTLHFEFLSGPVSSVGGFLNYVVATNNPYYDPAVFAIKALGQNGSVLEAFTLQDYAPISTAGQNNAGAFRGISRNSADIYAFEIQGAGVLQSLQFSDTSTSVPEPGTLLLVMSGLVACTSLRRGAGSQTKG